MIMWKLMMPRLFLTRSLPHYYDRRVNIVTQRLFGSKVGPDSPPGLIRIEDDQSALVGIDLDRLRDTIGKIRHEINYNSYDVNLILVGDSDMKAVNFEATGVNATTDILSFPFHEAMEPGILEPPKFDVPDYYCLGDMLIDVPYVVRSCQEDQQHSNLSEDPDDNEDDDTSEYEEEEEEREDRGVSLAMSNTTDPEQRLHQLLVHGMLHLVGYDHEDDDDYLAMVEREEYILKQLGL